MPTSIRHIGEKLKSFLADDALFNAAILLAVAVASFGLGRQSVTPSVPTGQEGSVILSGKSTPPPTAAALTPTPIKNPYIEESVEEQATVEDGEVVASKSGTKYHLPTCSGAKSIKPENLITFASRAEAEAAGYAPAANCPGLK